MTLLPVRCKILSKNSKPFVKKYYCWGDTIRSFNSYNVHLILSISLQKTVVKSSFLNLLSVLFSGGFFKKGQRNPFLKPGNTYWHRGDSSQSNTDYYWSTTFFSYWAQNTCFAKLNLQFSEGSHTQSLYINNPWCHYFTHDLLGLSSKHGLGSESVWW